MNDQYPILVYIEHNIIHISLDEMKSGVACEQTISKQDGKAIHINKMRKRNEEEENDNIISVFPSE